MKEMTLPADVKKGKTIMPAEWCMCQLMKQRSSFISLLPFLMQIVKIALTMPIIPIMSDLHWLPIRARINFKVLLLTFKALHGLAPQYVQSLISVKTCYNLRGSTTLLLAMPSVKF